MDGGLTGWMKSGGFADGWSDGGGVDTGWKKIREGLEEDYMRVGGKLEDGGRRI